MEEELKELPIFDDSCATKEELNNEARLRLNGDNTIITSVNALLNNYEIQKKIVNDKQDKNDENLITTNKTIVEAINEIKTANNTQITNIIEKQDKTDNNLKTNDKTIVGAINEVKANINSSTINKYEKVKEITINQHKYVFDEYDNNYWHMFVFEIAILNKKVIGILERPSGLNSTFTSSNVLIDYTNTSSVNLIFSPCSKTLEAKSWTNQNQIINKMYIYRKMA